MTTAAVALAAVLLTGCRAGGNRAARPDDPAPLVSTSTSAPGAPAGAPAGNGGPASADPAGAGGVDAPVDSQLGTVDGLFGQIDDQAAAADQAPADGDG
jgi:hypothetical protein